ncbi:T9SS type A sorting domain-containing protein [Aequorivita todarodis]|uniref:T9SS type A sorting domain-containing protein n=1 Tax=Aequorivita todarodis TaxID=2036821 RepID=UPI0023508CA1|nr:T9SS type A sorting domain-containing protein [Aequorivita todarodis]MDC8001091.1 T9SS type A sorting domain-containing protein [Aequorivita todarodis]
MKTIFTIACFLTVFVGTAQWTTDTALNTLVAESGELDMQARGTSDGQTYVVFWKNVGAPTNIELRMQVMDADGNRKFGDDGMLVSNQLPMSTFTVIMNTVVDADDNLYIGVTGTDDFSAYAFKMDSNGNQLWGANGISLGTGVPVTILPLSSGDAIVSWHDSGAAVMQKYDSSGNAVWPGTKTIGSGNTTAANLFELSNTDFEVVYHSILSGISSNLFAQRYDTDGDPVWSNAVQIADGTTAFNRAYTGVQDGDVVYMGYFSSTGNRFDSYLQRINPNGTLPWGINGSDFDTNQTEYEMDTEIAFQSGSQYVWAIATYRNATQSERGEYVQKFDKDSGARELTDHAKVVFPIGNDKSHEGSLQLRNGNPLFLMEEGENNGVSPTTLNAVHLDENGDFAWSEETRPVATFAADKSRINFTKEANMQNVAVFIEDKGTGLKIYAQNVVDDTAGIEEFSDVNLFFANPVKREINLKANVPIEEIAINNVLGQQVFSSNYKGETTININTESWKSGVYFMNVSTNEGFKKGIKLVKQ